MSLQRPSWSQSFNGSFSVSSLDVENFRTSTLMDPYSLNSPVTSHHASVTHVIYLANQDDSSAWNKLSLRIFLNHFY